MGRINAIVLAGDGKKGAVQPDVENKALLMINGRPMVSYVMDALRNAPEIGRISITGPVSELKKYLGDKADYYIEGGDSLFDNLNAGLKPFMEDEGVLVVTSDIPMITGDMVSDFISRCLDKKGDLCYPIVDKALNDSRFPGVRRTYVKLREGTYTGGNIVYINPSAVGRCEEFARKIIAYRKKPWKTGRMLGLRFLIGLFLGALTISSVEKRFSELLDIKASAIVLPYPEIGNDVDKPSDVEMVQHFFAAAR